MKSDEKQNLPTLNLSVVVRNGSDMCVRMRLRMEPLSANKNLEIRYTELSTRRFKSLSIRRSRHKTNSLLWKWLDLKGRRVNITSNCFSTDLDGRRKPVWELQYDCFQAHVGHRVQVHVLGLNSTLSSYLPIEHQSPGGDPVPVYSVTVDIPSKRFMVAIEAGQEVFMKLCHKSLEVVCTGKSPQLINASLYQTVNISFPHLVPCVCVQMYYSEVDARRHTTCPFQDKILPGGGDVLSSSSYLYASSLFEWKPICPSAQSKPAVSLCWQHHSNHSVCFPLQNSTLHETGDLLSLNGSRRVFCPFSSGGFSKWDAKVVPASQCLHVQISSSTPASFAAQLCVNKGEECIPKGDVQHVQMADGAEDVELTVPLFLPISGLCVQVWRTKPALLGRRIICPDYTHRRWGFIIAVSLACLVTITTLGILTYAWIKRRISVWRSAQRKPVLLVCSSDDTTHISTVCALASGLHEELHVDVRLAQWAHCSTQASLAHLGPAPWLYGQCQLVQRAGGMVLVAWSPQAQQAFLKWRDRGGGQNKNEKEWLDTPEESCAERGCSVTATVFNATLFSLWAGLRSERRGQGFGLVCFRGISGTSRIPKELRGIRRYCLPRDLSNLIHELNLKEHGTGKGVEDRVSGGCCLPRFFSKFLAFWLSQSLARRLDVWLPQTASVIDRKPFFKPVREGAGDKTKNLKKKRKKKDWSACPTRKKSVEWNVVTEKELLA
ncbi:interleukin-17 receptor E [Trichomycterus rosablanca]|uniref:interleukin-17 receptor E n=1 Tax=Trichomycterus rosablanca TaxID=2290929 RepID=UPI002F358607